MTHKEFTSPFVSTNVELEALDANTLLAPL